MLLCFFYCISDKVFYIFKKAKNTNLLSYEVIDICHLKLPALWPPELLRFIFVIIFSGFKHHRHHHRPKESKQTTTKNNFLFLSLIKLSNCAKNCPFSSCLFSKSLVISVVKLKILIMRNESKCAFNSYMFCAFLREVFFTLASGKPIWNKQTNKFYWF